MLAAASFLVCLARNRREQRRPRNGDPRLLASEFYAFDILALDGDVYFRPPDKSSYYKRP